MMTLPEETTAVLQALAQLELKLTTLISNSMAAMQKEHSASQLEQAKLNAIFAHREAVETITRRVDAHASEILRLNQQAERQTAAISQTASAIEALSAQLDRRALRLFTSITGYAFGAAALLGASTLAWALGHFFH